MKINDRFSIHKDAHCVVLEETTVSVAKKGKNKGQPVEARKLRYYPTVVSALQATVELSTDLSGDVSTLIESIQEAKREVARMMEEATHV